MNFKKNLFIIATFFLLSINSFAQESSFSLSPQTVFIQPGEQVPILVSFFNSSNHAETIAVEVISSSQNLITNPQTKEFVLHENEQTSFSIDVKAKEGLSAGNYTFTVKANFLQSSQEQSKQVMFTALQPSTIHLMPVLDGQEICLKGYGKNLQVIVKNNGTVASQVTLFSESQIFFPQFEEQSLFLNAGEEKTVSLRINFNDFTTLGSYSIPLFAMVNEQVVSQNNFHFTLVECLQLDDFSFDLTVEKNSLIMEKFEEKRISFVVSNLRDEVQNIFFSAVSDLAVVEGQFSFTLGPFESQESFIEIKARRDDEPKTHKVKLFAWSEFGEEKQTINVLVKELQDIKVVALHDELISQICSATQIAVFEVELTNRGDIGSMLRLSVENEFETIGVAISDEKIELKDGETKIARVIVSPSFDTSLGEKQIKLRIRGIGFNFEEKIPLKFTVVEAIQPLPKVELGFVSAPSELNVLAGDKKIINVKIENPSLLTATNVVLRVRGLDKTQLVFSEKSIPVLGPSESASVDLVLEVFTTANTQNYDLTLEAFSENSFASLPFKLSVRQPPKLIQTAKNEGFETIFGLFLFGSEFKENLVLLTIILIIILVGIIMYLLISSNNRQTVLFKRYQRQLTEVF